MEDSNEHLQILFNTINEAYNSVVEIQKTGMTVVQIREKHWSPLQSAANEICHTLPLFIPELHQHLSDMITDHLRKVLLPQVRGDPSNNDSAILFDGITKVFDLYEDFRDWIKNGLQQVSAEILKHELEDFILLADESFQRIILNANLKDLQEHLIAEIFCDHQRRRQNDYEIFHLVRRLRQFQDYFNENIRNYIMASYEEMYRKQAKVWSTHQLRVYLLKADPMHRRVIEARVAACLGEDNAKIVSDKYKEIFYGEALTQTFLASQDQYENLLDEERYVELRDINLVLATNLSCMFTVRLMYSFYIHLRISDGFVRENNKLVTKYGVNVHRKCNTDQAKQDRVSQNADMEKLLLEFRKLSGTLDAFYGIQEFQQSCGEGFMEEFRKTCSTCTLPQRLANYIESLIFCPIDAHPYGFDLAHNLLSFLDRPEKVSVAYCENLLRRIMMGMIGSKGTEMEVLRAFQVAVVPEGSNIRRMIEDQNASDLVTRIFRCRSDWVTRELRKKFKAHVLARCCFSNFRSFGTHMPEPVKKFQDDYERVYNERHKEKRIAWNSCEGYASLSTSLFGIGGNEVRVEVTVDQLTVLNILETNSYLSVESIANRLIVCPKGTGNYYHEKNYVKSAIASLMSEECAVVKKIPDVPHISDTDRVILNHKFKTEKPSITPPIPVYQNYDENIFSNAEVEDMQDEKVHVLAAAIMKSVKSYKSISERELYKSVMEKLKLLFPILQEPFEKAIAQLVEKNEISVHISPVDGDKVCTYVR